MNARPNLSEGRAGAAFTLIEIAICLGIIGFALVAIIGILPAGLQVQRDNKEDTIINQEGTYLMETIRNGAEGVFEFLDRTDGIIIEEIGTGNVITAVTNRAFAPTARPSFSAPREVVGLLSTPSDYDTNVARQVRAFIYAGSGSAVEQGSQVAFRYQVTIRNFAFTNASLAQPVEVRDELAKQLREVRLEFRWPLLPHGGVGNGRQIFRTLISGRLDEFAPSTNSIDVPLFFVREGI
jgi:type II secretory pathway pseudopilin PulG